VIGTRATRALTRALGATASASAQAAILRTLEAIRDPHSIPSASRLVDSPDVDVASAAIGVLRRFLRYEDAALAAAAFECVTSVTLDPTRPGPVRAAALEALSDLPDETTREVLRQLQDDTGPRLRAATGAPDSSMGRPAALADITHASLCPDPLLLRAMIEHEGRTAPLMLLGRVVEMVRAREEAETWSPRRTEWQAARAAAHQALAERGSRVVLYDLRESFRAVPGPLPVGFLAAIERIGDASCLEELAAAYVRARAASDAWWVEHLAAVFREIVGRERLTRRSPAIKRVLAKWPEAAANLLHKR
jgi:hypothetical protein